MTSIIEEADFDAERWDRNLQDQAVTVWYTAPTAIRMLMKAGAEIANIAFKLRFAPASASRSTRAVWWEEVLDCICNCKAVGSCRKAAKQARLDGPALPTSGHHLRRDEDGAVKVMDTPDTRAVKRLACHVPRLPE